MMQCLLHTYKFPLFPPDKWIVPIRPERWTLRELCRTLQYCCNNRTFPSASTISRLSVCPRKSCPMSFGKGGQNWSVAASFFWGGGVILVILKWFKKELPLNSLQQPIQTRVIGGAAFLLCPARSWSGFPGFRHKQYFPWKEETADRTEQSPLTSKPEIIERKSSVSSTFEANPDSDDHKHPWLNPFPIFVSCSWPSSLTGILAYWSIRNANTLKSVREQKISYSPTDTNTTVIIFYFKEECNSGVVYNV